MCACFALSLCRVCGFVGNCSCPQFSGVCEGEWVVAERSRAGLFEFIGIVLILATVLLAAFCGIKRFRAHRKASKIAAQEAQYAADTKAAEVDRIKAHHELRANEEKRLERQRSKLPKMTVDEAREFWEHCSAREEAQKTAHKNARSKWQTAVHRQLWRLGKVAEG
eukprot:SAG31_NODE_16696_length_699_cov_1.195000_2_plen_165_part_01